MALSQVISMFCCSVSVGNISVHFQAFILPLIVITKWAFCLDKESDNSQCSTHRDLISLPSSLSGMTWRNRTNWDRLNPVTKMLQETYLQSYLKTMCKCSSGKRCFKSKGWSHLPFINFMTFIYLQYYFWLHSHFTAFLHKCLKPFTVL